MTGLGARLARWRGIARSLRLYYGVPGRGRRAVRLYGRFIRPGDLCFDIGAHVGNRSRCWSRLGARVVALEPQPDFVRFLRWLFRDDPAVTVREAAAGAVPGRLALRVSRRTPTVTSMSADWMAAVAPTRGFAGVTWDEAIEVEVVTLDALIAEFGMPAFCKIDVEGFEPEVLRGTTAALPALSFEYLPAAKDQAAACVDLLAARGTYRFNRSTGESLRLEEPAWLDATAMRHWLLARQPDEPSGDVYAVLDGQNRPEKAIT